MNNVIGFLMWLAWFGVLCFFVERVSPVFGYRFDGEQEPVWVFAICLVIILAYFGYGAIRHHIDSKVEQGVNDRVAEMSRNQKREREYFGE